jgi:hypothetical protein
VNSKRRRAGGVVAGIAIGILVLLGLLVAAAILFVRNIRVEESVSGGRKTVRVETPLGSLRVREYSTVSPRQLGLPVYPGAIASAEPGKAVDLEFDIAGGQKQFDVVASEYSTTDSVEKVIEFYRKDLPQWSVKINHNGGVEMKYSEKGCQRIVSIKDQGGLTRITLVEAGEAQAN